MLNHTQTIHGAFCSKSAYIVVDDQHKYKGIFLYNIDVYLTSTGLTDPEYRNLLQIEFSCFLFMTL